MTVQPGQFLKDATRDASRFRVKELLASGEHYQILLTEDTQMDDKLVCAKAIEYETELIGDPEYVAGRRRALRREMAFLTLSSHLLPEPIDWLELPGSPVDGQNEPVLLYEYQHGSTLHKLITQRHPEGMALSRALRIFRELLTFCEEIHGQDYIWRDFDPRHVIVGFDDIIHLVGCGNAVERGEKLNVYKMRTSPLYTAPEIRRELSGKVVRPACDVYSLGCLLSFMLTGIEPQSRPEGPLDPDVYDALRDEDKTPIGVRLLIAKCIQPLAQKRFKSAKQLLGYAHEESLPDPNDQMFSMVMLPSPWSGPEGMDNRSLRSKISTGPLVSDKDEHASATLSPTPEQDTSLSPAAREDTALQEQEPKKKRNTALILGVIGVVVMLCVILGIVASVILFAVNQ